MFCHKAYQVVTYWENMEAIKEFVGDAADIAVVPIEG